MRFGIEPSALRVPSIQWNWSIDIGTREISANLLNEKVPLRPIAFLPNLHAKEFAERGKVGCLQTRKQLQFLAFGRVSGGCPGCNIFNGLKEIRANRPIRDEPELQFTVRDWRP